MNLLQRGKFRLSSGRHSDFKIDCDALTDEDIETAAYLLCQRLPRYEETIGIPTGGLRLAAAMKKYERVLGCLLIVDDVLTTGASMEKKRAEILNDDPDMPIRGAVLFARGPVPDWITPLFRMEGT